MQVWFVRPSVLLHRDMITSVFPQNSMTTNEKINALSRGIILWSILATILSGHGTYLLSGFAALLAIYTWYKYTTTHVKESFENGGQKQKNLDTPHKLKSALKKDFYKSTVENPFGNVLLPEIGDNPMRKAAEPAFNPYTKETIKKNMKKQIQKNNPGIDTDKELFGDLFDEFNLDNSMQRFYSTANTRVANDQGAFAQFLYGDMPSSKENNAGGAMARVANTYRFTDPPVHQAIG